MRRFIFIPGTILMLVLLPWLMPGTATANSSPNEYAVGGGFENYGAAEPIHFAFSAHCQAGMAGVPCATPSGYVVLHNVQTFEGTFADISGPVSCLNVRSEEHTSELQSR